MQKDTFLSPFTPDDVCVDVTQSACSAACISCTNNTCASCKVGSYLEFGSCHNCPEHCTSCWNSGACNNCEAGYLGLACDRTCSTLCANNTCDKDSGICTHGCIDGYFLSGSLCFQCSTYCKTCANFSNNCQECKKGYYGQSCQYSCSHCKDGICSNVNCTYGCSNEFYLNGITCNRCFPPCTSCSIRFDNCHTCEDGYFGPSCQFLCSDCSPCNKQDGLCFPSTTSDPTVNRKTSQQATSTTAAAIVKITQEATTQSNIIICLAGRVCEPEVSPEPWLNLAIAGWTVVAILTAIVITVLILYRRKLKEIKTTETLHIRLTEENVVSQDYTTLAMETRGDGHLYSSLDNTENIVTRE